MSVLDGKNCVNCCFSTRMSLAKRGEVCGGYVSTLACEYILMRGKCRPCPVPKHMSKNACKCWAPRKLKRSYVANYIFKSKGYQLDPLPIWREADDEAWQKMLRELAADADS